MIFNIKTLVFLDERGINENERRRVSAWAEGGPEAEEAERQKIAQEIREAEDNYVNKNRDRYTEKEEEDEEYAKWLVERERILANKRRIEKLNQERATARKEIEDLKNQDVYQKQYEKEQEEKRQRMERKKQEKALLEQKAESELTAQEKVDKIKARNTLRDDQKQLGCEEQRQLELEVAESRLDNINENLEAKKKQVKILEDNLEKKKRGEHKLFKQYYVQIDKDGNRRYINLDKKREEIIRKRDDQIQQEASKRVRQYNQKLMNKFVDENMSRYTDSTIQSIQEVVTWSKNLEEKLETILIEKQFDFEAACEEFNNLLIKLGFEDDCIYKPFSVQKLKSQWKEVEMNKYMWEDDQQKDSSVDLPVPDLERLGTLDLDDLD